MDSPIINDSQKRKKSIVENTPAVFDIKENSEAIDTAPFIEMSSQSEVANWCGLIIQASNKHGVDPGLAMAIMYMETTHGWYDKLYPDFLDDIYPARKTILPMNIHYRYWKKMGVTKEKLNTPLYNIEFGIILLARIQNRIENPTIRKIATVYNFLGAENVNDYGARVGRIYLTKPWKRQGCTK